MFVIILLAGGAAFMMIANWRKLVQSDMEKVG
jgi:hypothetical protein